MAIPSGMRVRRGVNSQPFVTIPNETARCKKLSFRARGLLVHLLSLPDEWHVTTAMLAEDNPEGREAIRTALRELCEHGYARVIKQQDERGRWFKWIEVYSTPQDGEPAANPSPNPSPTPRETLASPREALDRSPETRPRADLQGQAKPQVAPKPRNPNVGGLGVKRKTEPKDGSKDVGSTRVEHGGLPAGPRETRVRESAIADKIRHVRVAARRVYGSDDEFDDDEALALHARIIEGRNVTDPVRYIEKVFIDTPHVDTLLANCHDPELCHGCGRLLEDMGGEQPSGLCPWCDLEAR